MIIRSLLFKLLFTYTERVHIVAALIAVTPSGGGSPADTIMRKTYQLNEPNNDDELMKAAVAHMRIVECEFVGKYEDMAAIEPIT